MDGISGSRDTSQIRTMKTPLHLRTKIRDDYDNVIPHGYRQFRIDVFAYLALALLFVLLRMMGVL